MKKRLSPIAVLYLERTIERMIRQSAVTARLTWSRYAVSSVPSWMSRWAMFATCQEVVMDSEMPWL